MSRRKSRAAAKDGKETAAGSSANVQPAAAATRTATGEEAQAPTLLQWFLPLLLVGIGLAAYYNSFAGAFLLDDELRIVNNPRIRQLWPPWAALAHTARPIVQLSLALNYAIGGVNPWGYHAFNLAVHLVAGLLLYGIVRRMLVSDELRARYGAASRWLAVAVAGIWLAHPLQTASVTYIIQRAESLMGLFFLLTLYCGIRACESPRPRGWSIAAVVACALGMGSKEVMVAAPILMWLYDRTFVSRTFGDTFRRRPALYAGLAATWLVIGVIWLILGTSPAANRAERQEAIVAGVNPWTYAVTQFEVIVHYLRLAVWPSPLVFDYAWPVADPLAVVPAAVVVLALLAGTVFALRKRLWLGFWGAWFFLILAPTSSVLPLADLAFEHRMYLPLAAVVAVIVIGGHDVLGLAGGRLGVSAPSRGWLEGGLVIAAVAVLGYASVRRNLDYRSELAMWTDTVAKRPNNARARSNLGNALDRQGKHVEALVHYRESTRLKPDYPQAQNNLGAALYRGGQIKEAIARSTEALRLDPNFAEAHNNLGAALYRDGRADDAIKHLAQALRLNPNYAEAHNNLGAILGGQGKIDEAIGHFANAVRLKPEFAEARDNLRAGQALLRADKAR